MCTPAAGLYKTLVREWRHDAIPVPGPAPFRYMCAAGPPGMTIRNCYLASDVFRKIHIEYAIAGPLEIVHHVAYPHPSKDVPIFGLDVVWSCRKPIMAIADFSGPMRWTFERAAMGQPRDMPAWGSVFSPDVIFVADPDVAAFTNYVVQSRRQYVHRASSVTSVCDHTAFHSDYCAHQLQNAKTRGVLTAAFGRDVAEAYMRTMFDM